METSSALLTPAGRAYAELLLDSEPRSTVAAVALYGRGLWPDAYVNLAIDTMNAGGDHA